MPLFERAAKKVYEGMLVGRREEFNDLPEIQVIRVEGLGFRVEGLGFRRREQFNDLPEIKVIGMCLCVRHWHGLDV